MWSVQRIPTAVNLGFLDQSRYFFIQVAPHEAEWTSFQTPYFSENLVGPGIEPWTSGSVARNSDPIPYTFLPKHLEVALTTCSGILCPCANSHVRAAPMYSHQPENRRSTIIHPGMYAADTMNINVYQAAPSHIPQGRNLFTQ
jgi:hypothetical protein